MRREDADRLVRPTIRCLLDDLADEGLGPEALARAVATAAQEMDCDARFLLPIALTDARHPVLDRANAIVTDDAAHREPIAAFPGESVIKVKTSARRGAVWLDEAGTWWLLAAGRRKDDGPGDFYRDLEGLAGRLDTLAPTESDYRYQRYEAAYLGECAREREAQLAVLRTLLAAAATLGEEKTVEVFGAVLSIRLDTGEYVPELTLAFSFVRFDEQDRFPVDLIGFVPGHENIDAWEYLPAFEPTQSACWYTLVDPARIEAWAIAEEIDELLRERSLPPKPTTAARDDVSHLAPTGAVTMGYVEGTEIAALCGVRFTPHRDPDDFEICPDCRGALTLLRADKGNRVDE